MDLAVRPVGFEKAHPVPVGPEKAVEPVGIAPAVDPGVPESGVPQKPRRVRDESGVHVHGLRRAKDKTKSKGLFIPRQTPLLLPHRDAEIEGVPVPRQRAAPQLFPGILKDRRPSPRIMNSVAFPVLFCKPFYRVPDHVLRDLTPEGELDAEMFVFQIP